MRFARFSVRIKKHCILFACVIAVTGSAYSREVSKVVAAVNNEVITSKDIDDYCAAMALRISEADTPSSCDDPEFRNAALERLIEDKLVLAEAKKETVDVPQSMIEEKLSDVILSYPSREAFEGSLRERGLTLTSLKDLLKQKIIMQSIIEYQVRSFIDISPQEISDFYMDNKELFAAPQTYMFYIAQADSRGTLQAISDAIDESGIRLVHKQYDDILFPVESASDQLLPQLVRALEGLDEGEKIIEEIDGRYYFIYLERINSPRILALDDVKKRIYGHLKEIKFKKRFDEWVENLRTTAVIKRYATP